MLSSLFFLKILWIKATICFTFSYLIGFISIKKFIQFIHNKKLFQPIRAEGPETHLKAKKNTPTMGGIFIILSTLITTFLFIDITNRYILVVCCIMLTFASIGLVDDILKVVYKNPKGFRGSYKILIQFLVIGMAFLWLNLIDSTHGSTYVFLPFFESVKFFYLPLPFYIIFVTMLIVGTSNAVNLTDGLDGLVSVPVIINLLCLILLIHASSSPELALKFSVPPIMFSGELIFFCISLIGAILAFLTFNLKPAKIFMGDVGSLGIGSTLGIIAIIVKQEVTATTETNINIPIETIKQENESIKQHGFEWELPIESTVTIDENDDDNDNDDDDDDDDISFNFPDNDEDDDEIPSTLF
jgi:phospho-N-acetylmuramoyl-pentapeptide-transferase